MSYLCQTGGGLAQEREEGDSTKLHLKLGLSPLESPLHSRSVSLALSLSLSLAFLGGSAAPARLLRKSELLHQGDNCQSAGGGVQPVPPCLPTPTRCPLSLPHPEEREWGRLNRPHTFEVASVSDATRFPACSSSLSTSISVRCETRSEVVGGGGGGESGPATPASSLPPPPSSLRDAVLRTITAAQRRLKNVKGIFMAAHTAATVGRRSRLHR